MYDPKRLHALQRLDKKIDQLTREKNIQPEKKEIIEVSQKIEKLKILKENHDALFAHASRDQKRVENDLIIVEDKLKKSETRLYNGEVTNPKELKSMQDEIGHLRDKKDELETELLEAIDKTENLFAENGKLSVGLSSFEERKKELSDGIESLDSDKDELIENLAVEREAVSQDIDNDVKRLYDRLRKEKDGIAVTVLKDGTCQGCHITLSESELNTYSDEGEIWRCSNCSRVVVKETV